MFSRRVGVAVFLSVWLLCSGALWAAPTTSQQAEKAVRGWLKGNPKPLDTALGEGVLRTETFSDPNGEAAYHVVYLDPSGFVIVPADDLVEPIICFSSDGSYDASEENCLGALVSRDVPSRIATARSFWRASNKKMEFKDLDESETAAMQKAGAKAQRKWAKLSAYAGACEGGSSNRADLAGDGGGSQGDRLETISEVWVAPLVQSKWAQGNVCYNPVLACYNYYTPPYEPGDPNNYVCGCTATAGAQLMRYHEHPTEGIGVHEYEIRFDGMKHTAYTRGGDGEGGPYNWGLMVLEPGSSCETLTQAQREAIGALCYDAGICCKTAYSSRVSCAIFSFLETALTSLFGYSNSIHASELPGLPKSNFNAMINPNLDARHPVMLALYNPGGHAVVCDGYGYDTSTLYHHINMGYAGQGMWYNLPYVGNYKYVHQCIYNVFVEGTGEIISGRVTEHPGWPVSGVTITAERDGGGTYQAQTDSKGIYALLKVPSDSSYTITATKEGYSFPTQYATTGTSLDSTDYTGNCWGVNFAWDVPTELTPYSNFETTRIGENNPFRPQGTTYTLTNNGTTSIDWTASDAEGWLEITPNAGTLNPSQSVEISVCVGQNAYNLGKGDYSELISFTNTTDGYTQKRMAFLHFSNDYFTEEFEGGDSNIDQMTTLYPDGSDIFYKAWATAVSQFPTDPSGGTVITFSTPWDYSWQQVCLDGGQQVSLYGVNYSQFYVGNNGSIVFHTGVDPYDISLEGHFTVPRISGLLTYLGAWEEGATVSYKQLKDKVAVTFENVPHINGSGQLYSFQVEMFFNGRIRITHLNADLDLGTPAVVGLSQGNGVPEDFAESDWSDYSSLWPEVQNVDKDIWYTSIQDSVDEANSGDEIVVYPSGYCETVDFGGKGIVLRSMYPDDWFAVGATIIDGKGSGTVVTFDEGEAAGSVLTGFTITGGDAASAAGGGICCVNSSPTISNCVITGNSALFSGGMDNDGASPTVKNCVFSGNTAEWDGGGMGNFNGSSPILINCLFYDNTASFWGYGGGMENVYSSPTIINCTFFDNYADYKGGGIDNYNCSPLVKNCIFWGNDADDGEKQDGPEIYNGGSSAPNFAYCDIEGALNGSKCGGGDSTDGGGNINSAPSFANSNDPSGTDNVWGTKDDGLSGGPCIDAGDNSATSEPNDITGNTRVIDGDGDETATVDMGPYEYDPDS
jgi:hypothetical protein